LHVPHGRWRFPAAFDRLRGVLEAGRVRQRSRVKAAIAYIFLACAVGIVGVLFSSSLQGTDFPDFYCAARILLDGHAGQLYNIAVQYRYQAEYAGRVGTLYIHPPFESLLYLSVAWLPLRYAYLLWSFINMGLLVAAARRLASTALHGWNWEFSLVLSFAFVPLLLCLIQGQDSVLLLLLLVLTYGDLRRERDFSAGCWLGLGLFKFQLVLPIAVVLFLARSGIHKRSFASGFAAVALALMALSAAICGGSVFSLYPKFLIHLPVQRFAGIIPRAMPNFRGLAYTVFNHDQSPGAIAVVGAVSAAAMIHALYTWKRLNVRSGLPPMQQRNSFDVAFSNTILFSILVSYHLNPHDLTLLLLPITLILHSIFAINPPLFERTKSTRADWTFFDWTTVVLLTILLLPPLHLLALKAHFYALVAIPLIMLFANIGFVTGEESVPRLALHVHND
jgi:Glycosyltransferase family 87